MKTARTLAVSDKVTLHEHWLPGETHMRPRLRRGEISCVREVEQDAAGRVFVRLVGHRCLPPRRGGKEVSFTASAFCLVAPAQDV